MVWEKKDIGTTTIGTSGEGVKREDAERLVEEVRGDDPGLASYLRIEEREVEAG